MRTASHLPEHLVGLFFHPKVQIDISTERNKSPIKQISLPKLEDFGALLFHYFDCLLRIAESQWQLPIEV